MELILIRHGLPETVVREDGQPADAPLSIEGRLQAERMAGWLADEEISRVYASPLARARQTAAPLAGTLGLEIEIDDGVAEYDRNSHSYVPLEEVRRTDRERYREMMRTNAFGGDNPQAFRATVVEALEGIIADNRGARVAVVCHGGVINSWASKVLKMEDVFFFNPTYTSINRFMAAGSGERTVITLNEHAHLRD
ncbi:MAG: histidine phosphatase family protein [Dehalococcoidia bacterium]|nr:histidine phosphatase family protein [Dehalococcoidia bacterium]MCA9824192.1 histidine phosphatase family protein [Dehalococcoidia bacterium]MCA9845137.1 histidine phosphatase family protein [Dehalococcoidia bacterium]MCA9852990.1 histidine phosphatase family protein [Dehalococcoidia bacterium]